MDSTPRIPQPPFFPGESLGCFKGRRPAFLPSRSWGSPWAFSSLAPPDACSAGRGSLLANERTPPLFSSLQAGLVSSENPEQLLIALEPEAASIYCRKLRLNQLIDLSYRPQANGRPSDLPIDSSFRQGRWETVRGGGPRPSRRAQAGGQDEGQEWGRRTLAGEGGSERVPDAL